MGTPSKTILNQVRYLHAKFGAFVQRNTIFFLKPLDYIGSDSLYCGKWGKVLKAYSDLDLDPMMLNIEIV